MHIVEFIQFRPWSHFIQSSKKEKKVKMKLILVAIFAVFAAVTASPVQVSDNNMGDIVSVGVNLEADISNNIDQRIVSVIIALINQQEIDVDLLNHLPSAAGEKGQGKLQITPEMIQQFQKLMSKS